MHRLPAWLASPEWLPPRRDVLLVLGVCGATIVCVYVSPLSAPSGFARPGDIYGLLVALGMTIPLAWRRRRPVLTLAIVAVFSELSNLRNYATDPADFFSWFAIGSAAFYTDRRTTIALALLATCFELYWWLDWDLPDVTASDITWALAIGIVPALLGDTLRTHRQAADAIADREWKLRELEASSAAESQRLRIAREMHDIVGHHLSAIGVHARATALLVHSEPDRAVEDLRRLDALAARALSETRQSVASLRSESDAGGPQPQLAEIDELASIARAHGVQIALRRTGVARPLRDSTELCGYRVVQEALTNVVKHAARPARAEVTIDYRPSELEITIVSHAAEPSVGKRHYGYGLVGMRERVSLAGGSLRAGPATPQTWVVQATLPTPAGA